MNRKNKEEMTFENIELEPIRLDEVTGIVLSPVEDSHGHIVSKEEIEEAAKIWNEKFQHLTISHRDKLGALINLEELTNPATFKDCFDESFQILSSFTTDTQSVLNGESIPGGSWLLSLKILDPEIFELIKQEKLNGFSIGALGIKNKNGTVRISNLLAPEVSLVQKPANHRNWLIIKDEDFEEIRKPLSLLKGQAKRQPKRKPSDIQLANGQRILRNGTVRDNKEYLKI